MTETTLGPLLSTFLYLELQPLLLLGRGLYEQRRPLKTGGHGDGLYRTSQLLNLPDWTAILMLTFPCEQLFNEGTCQENWMLWLHDRIQTFQPVGKLIIHFGSIENYVMVHVVVLSMLWYVCVLDNNQMYLRVVGDCCSFFNALYRQIGESWWSCCSWDACCPQVKSSSYVPVSAAIAVAELCG